MHTLWALIKFLWDKLPFTIGRKESDHVEQVLDAVDGLTGGQQKFIGNLEGRVTELEKINRKLIKAVRARRKRTETLEGTVTKLTTDNVECERRCSDLQRRIETLEENAKQDHDYAHDHAHDFEDFMVWLAEDLIEQGIAPDRAESVLRRVRERQDERAKDQ